MEFLTDLFVSSYEYYQAGPWWQAYIVISIGTVLLGPTAGVLLGAEISAGHVAFVPTLATYAVSVSVRDYCLFSIIDSGINRQGSWLNSWLKSFDFGRKIIAFCHKKVRQPLLREAVDGGLYLPKLIGFRLTKVFPPYASIVMTGAGAFLKKPKLLMLSVITITQTAYSWVILRLGKWQWGIYTFLALLAIVVVLQMIRQYKRPLLRWYIRFLPSQK